MTGYLLVGWSGKIKDGILAKWKAGLEMFNARIAAGRLDNDHDKRDEETYSEE